MTVSCSEGNPCIVICGICQNGRTLLATNVSTILDPGQPLKRSPAHRVRGTRTEVVRGEDPTTGESIVRFLKILSDDGFFEVLGVNEIPDGAELIVEAFEWLGFDKRSRLLVLVVERRERKVVGEVEGGHDGTLVRCCTA